MATPDQLHKQALQSTYLTEKSSASVLVDGFDREKLARELATSIKLEHTRQKIDDTKKRAITVARDYNEFKNMVLMADQKRVTTKEMQEFGRAASAAGNHHGREEKGNKQRFSRIAGTGKPQSTERTSRSAKRRQEKRSAKANNSQVSTSPKPATSTANVGRASVATIEAATQDLLSKVPRGPKNTVDFSRAWDRYATNNEKRLSYLMSFKSQKTVVKVLKPCLDFTLLGTIVEVFARARSSGVLPKSLATVCFRPEAKAQVQTVADKIADFFVGFSKIPRFSSTVGLLEKTECDQAIAVLREIVKLEPARGNGLEPVLRVWQAAADAHLDDGEEHHEETGQSGDNQDDVADGETSDDSSSDSSSDDS